MTCWSARICTRWRGPAVMALALLASSAVASAQAPAQAQAPAMNMADHRGALQGRVRNAQGAPVPDTEVSAINEENGAQFVANTNAQGAFEFGALPMQIHGVHGLGWPDHLPPRRR